MGSIPLLCLMTMTKTKVSQRNIMDLLKNSKNSLMKNQIKKFLLKKCEPALNI